ncbi:hypothetical protein FAI40_04895 [Acetobacteraceae bacterium]|nr:hypothetical protein FAI40_04895 [Acetobacteraceae bacterium]
MNKAFAVPILGISCPDWLICALLGLLGILFCHTIFTKIGWDHPPIERFIVYTLLGIIGALSAWMLFFS